MNLYLLVDSTKASFLSLVTSLDGELVLFSYICTIVGVFRDIYI